VALALTLPPQMLQPAGTKKRVHQPSEQLLQSHWQVCMGVLCRGWPSHALADRGDAAQGLHAG
jgi:hypothetical protein